MDRGIETFLFDFAELDLSHLVGGELHANAQAEFGDDVDVATEGEGTVEMNVPPVGPAFLFKDLGDLGHSASGVLTSVRHGVD